MDIRVTFIFHGFGVQGWLGSPPCISHGVRRSHDPILRGRKLTMVIKRLLATYESWDDPPIGLSSHPPVIPKMWRSAFFSPKCFLQKVCSLEVQTNESTFQMVAVYVVPKNKGLSIKSPIQSGPKKPSDISRMFYTSTYKLKLTP